MVTVSCAGCGAEVTVEPDRRFVDCSFCGSSSVLDLGAAATCFQLRQTLGGKEARGKVEASIRQQGHYGGYNIGQGSALLVPFWVVSAGGVSLSTLAVDRPELRFSHTGQNPTGQLEPIHAEDMDAFDGEVIEPTVPLPSALARLGPATVANDERKAQLVYVPFERVPLTLGSFHMTALVNRASGTVHVPYWPTLREQKQLDRKMALLLLLASTAFTAVAFLVPGAGLTLLALIVVAGLLYAWLERLLRPGEKS